MLRLMCIKELREDVKNLFEESLICLWLGKEAAQGSAIIGDGLLGG